MAQRRVALRMRRIAAMARLRFRYRLGLGQRPPVDPPTDADEKLYLFVGGSHRSGTTLLTDLIERHPDATGMEGTGWPADEGQFLQRTYTPIIFCGGAERYGYCDRMRLLEPTPDEALCARRELYRAWYAWWDPMRDVMVEKSPPNLIKSRYLQAVFPRTLFVFVLRHPVVACLAMSGRGWTGWTIADSLRHWVRTYSLMREDLPVLRRKVVVRY